MTIPTGQGENPEKNGADPRRSTTHQRFTIFESIGTSFRFIGNAKSESSCSAIASAQSTLRVIPEATLPRLPGDALG
jgi:hypothetical protein